MEASRIKERARQLLKELVINDSASRLHNTLADSMWDLHLKVKITFKERNGLGKAGKTVFSLTSSLDECELGSDEHQVFLGNSSSEVNFSPAFTFSFKEAFVLFSHKTYTRYKEMDNFLITETFTWYDE